MTPEQQLYYSIGQMAYSIAAADGRIQKEEKDKLRSILEESNGIGFSEDYANIIFEILQKDHTPLEYSQGWALDALKGAGPWLTDQHRKEFTRILRNVASAYPPVTKNEKKLLDLFISKLNEGQMHSSAGSGTIKKLLVPIDYSDLSYSTIEFVMPLAAMFDADVILYHGIHVPVQIAEVPLTYLTEKDIRNDAYDRIQGLTEETKRKFPNIKISAHATVDFVEEGISSAAKDLHADMIIMGVNERTYLQRTLAGTNASGVINKCETPVMIVPPGAIYKEIKKIVIACDLHPAAYNKLLKPIKDLSDQFDAEIETVTIVNKGEDLTEMRSHFNKLNLDQSIGKSIHKFHLIENNDFREGMQDFLSISKPDLLVMIHHSRGFLSRIFSEQHSKEMMFGNNIPLLIVSDKE